MATDPDPGQPTGAASLAGRVLDGRVHDTDPLMVTSPDIDRGQLARRVFGTAPDAGRGDPVKLLEDPTGRLVLLAWEPA